MRSGEGRGDGVAEDDAFREIFLELEMEGFEGELGATFVARSREKESQVGVRGVGELTSHFELLIDEAVEVVMPCELNGRAVRGRGLDDDFARHFSATGTASDLGEELEGAFASAEVGGVEREVGIEDADEGDVGEIESLGDHLCSEEDLDLLGAEVAQGVAEGILATGGVGVESGNLGAFEDFIENDFGLFCAVSLKADGGVFALGAEFWDDGLVAADVADEPFLGAMISEGDGTVVALNGVAAGRALEGAGEAAAVEEEDDLFVLFKAFVDGGAEAVREDGVAAFLLP